MPDYIKEAFIFSFTVGLREPQKRLIEKQWLDLLKRLRGEIVSCSCGIQNFLSAMDTDENGKLVCLCKNHFSKPLELKGGKAGVLLSESAKLFDDNVKPIGEVVRNKKNPALWGLKNLSESDWSYTLPNGEERIAKSGGAVPIFLGTRITIGENSFSVEE